MYTLDIESRDISTLSEEFRVKVASLLENCSKRGVEMRPFYTRRGPKVQAVLWRRSRSALEIASAIKNLKKSAPVIAAILEEVGPQYGRWATNALPGQSWHQWGEAVDCFVLNTMGQAVWSAQHVGYSIYAEEAEKLGLVAGHHWKLRDSVHVQLQNRGVREFWTWVQIEALVRDYYSSDGRPSNQDGAVLKS